MSIQTHHVADNAEINITPMLDVVFIMLIFFIVTSSFNQEEGLLVTNKAISVVSEQKAKVVTVILDQEGGVRINSQQTTYASMESVLANLRAQIPDIKAQVLVANDVTTGALVNALDQIKLAGINHYHVSAYH